MAARKCAWFSAGHPWGELHKGDNQLPECLIIPDAKSGLTVKHEILNTIPNQPVGSTELSRSPIVRMVMVVLLLANQNYSFYFRKGALFLIIDNLN